MRNSPSCVCCAFSCTLTTDITTALPNICGGTWTESITTTPPLGAKTARYSNLSASGPWYVEVNAQVATLTGATTLRLLGGLSDCDNYVYIEVDMDPEEVDGVDGYRYTYRFGYVSGGSNNVLSVSNGGWFDDTGGGAGLSLCWDGEQLYGCVGDCSELFGGNEVGQQIGRFQSHTVTPPGGKVGIEVVSLGMGSTAAFSGLGFYTGFSDEHPECPACLPNCCEGHSPHQLTLVSTMPSNAWQFNSACTFDCSQFEGTWLLTKKKITGFAVEDGYNYDDWCEWWLEDIPVEYVCDGVPSSGTATLRVQILEGIPKATFEADGGFAIILFWNSGLGPLPPCDEWTEADPLPLDFSDAVHGVGFATGNCSNSATGELSIPP